MVTKRWTKEMQKQNIIHRGQCTCLCCLIFFSFSRFRGSLLCFSILLVLGQKLCCLLQVVQTVQILMIAHCNKELAVFPSPAGMSLIKLFLGGNNLVFFPPRESLVSDIPAGDGKIANSFLQCNAQLSL